MKNQIVDALAGTEIPYLHLSPPFETCSVDLDVYGNPKSTSWLAEKKSIVPSPTIHEGSSYNSCTINQNLLTPLKTNSKPTKGKRRKWEEQIKLALAVAHALTAAADASITTAQVATEVVWFTSTPQSSHQCENEVEEFSVIRFQGKEKVYGLKLLLEAEQYTQTIKEVGMIVFCQRKRQMHCLWVGKRPSEVSKYGSKHNKWKMEALVGPMGRYTNYQK
ncbi:hypothetical protein CMV_023897 [Castanea mollissima]|uniref:Uncharacterized protein n=1 Tax=Castanea mollissima TaxID=60419 RepID=A0A8J4VA65_9ROSI|nr:hypothetical protein CMV_023897 [Castanea mollissima]